MTTTNRPYITHVECDHCSQQYFGKDASLELAIHVARRHNAPEHLGTFQETK